MFNRTTLIVLVVALAAGIGLLAGQRFFAPPPSPGPALQAVRLLPAPRPLPDFDLAQSDGTRLVPGELRGQWTVVFLGFTHCPDVCPMTLAQMAQAQKRWEDMPASIRPRILFVSVDPERDTPAKIGEYAHHFHADTLAATGPVPMLEDLATALGMVFMKVPPPDGVPADQYSVDHSATLAVLDPQGRMAGLLRPPFDPAAIAADLRALTGAGG